MENTTLSRVVAVEEHVAISELTKRLPEAAMVGRGFLSRDQPFGKGSMMEDLCDTEKRLRKLDAAGISVQVLSYPMPGAALLAPRDGVLWSRQMNNGIAECVVRHPDRYAGLAHLPLTDPDSSADELQRAIEQLSFKGALVTGATDGRYLDHPSFDPLLRRAELLGVPIYLHPGPSPKIVRDALYGGLPDDLSFWMSVSGWGWHADTAVHLLRLMLSGAFERFPNLKIIVGHLGEGLQVMLPRLDQQFHTFAGFEQLPSAIIRNNVWVSMSGFFFLSSFLATLDAFGSDRVLYSVDYPYGSLELGKSFLETLPVDAETLAKIAHGNADALLRLESPGR